MTTLKVVIQLEIVENRGKAVFLTFAVFFVYTATSHVKSIDMYNITYNVSQTFVSQTFSTLEGDFGSDLYDCAQMRNMVDFLILWKLEPWHLHDDIY